MKDSEDDRQKRSLARAKAHAAIIDAAADRAYLDLEKPFDRYQATVLAAKEREGLKALQLAQEPVLGFGGEMVPQGKDVIEYPGAVCVTQYPTLTSAQASIDRLHLASEAQCYDAAVDAAHAIAARDATERMLAHQLAAAHQLAMRLVARAEKALSKAALYDDPEYHANLSISAGRVASSAARLMEAYQRGMVAIARIRSGGQQTVTVVHQHVNVAAGAQAAVAGSIQNALEAER